MVGAGWTLAACQPVDGVDPDATRLPGPGDAAVDESADAAVEVPSDAAPAAAPPDALPDALPDAAPDAGPDPCVAACDAIAACAVIEAPDLCPGVGPQGADTIARSCLGFCPAYRQSLVDLVALTPDCERLIATLVSANPLFAQVCGG